MRIDAVRVARQTDQLDAVVAFYRDVVGLPVIGGFDDHDGYTGVMLGAPGEAAHLEFTTHSSGSPGQPGGADDLLVLYADPEGVQEVVARARALGIEEVAPANPYWARCRWRRPRRPGRPTARPGTGFAEGVAEVFSDQTFDP